ncbi:proline iminopeptidase-family hydrolase [Phytohabitans rumicis]|uniref:Proline iminopeptidase n=1 Tax=Phytohabitans rumicis TaxID=1076125 RepID=A0A6V8LLB4_9ACTN|nr:proline iminopeptidase-family hydrolase [Phytohabitans rumicis]GFJ94857.1 amino acid amidase [Phytohabitans rumicis]
MTTVAYRGHETWYRVIGDGPRAPVVILHGGPGAGHDYCVPMGALAGDGRAVVLYDQLGCGNSTHLPDADPGFWTVELWVEELANLVRTLGIADRFHLLGQSWGGMLAAEYALAHPDGLLSVSICDSPAANELWRAAAHRLRAALPPDVLSALERHEAAGTLDAEEYQAAVRVYEQRHVCRLDPMPAPLAATYAQMAADPTVYHTTNGPHEFSATGTFRDWTIVDRLPGITAPTLVVAGAYDEAAPEVWAPFVERIPDVRSHVFPNSSHLPHLEEPDAFLAVVGAFLRAHDA